MEEQQHNLARHKIIGDHFEFDDVAEVLICNYCDKKFDSERVAIKHLADDW